MPRSGAIAASIWIFKRDYRFGLCLPSDRPKLTITCFCYLLSLFHLRLGLSSHVPELNRKTPHRRDQRNLLPLRVSFYQALIKLPFLLIVLHPAPRRLAQQPPNPRRSLARNMAFPVPDFTAFIAPWCDSPIGPDLLSALEPIKITNLHRVGRSRQLAYSLFPIQFFHDRFQVRLLTQPIYSLVYPLELFDNKLQLPFTPSGFPKPCRLISVWI